MNCANPFIFFHESQPLVSGNILNLLYYLPQFKFNQTRFVSTTFIGRYAFGYAERVININSFDVTSLFVSAID